MRLMDMSFSTAPWLSNDFQVEAEGTLISVNPMLMDSASLVVSESADLLEQDAFLREIRLMKALGRHSQVVSLLGACMTSEPILLVLEYCALGDLRGYLSSKRQTAISLQSASVSSSYLPVTCVSQLTLTTLLSFSRQIAMGMVRKWSVAHPSSDFVTITFSFEAQQKRKS